MTKKIFVGMVLVAFAICAVAVAQQRKSTDETRFGAVEVKRTQPPIVKSSGILVIPWHISYQGYITDDVGDPINDTLNMTFRIYSVSAGGSELWNENHPAVLIEAGLFNEVLGISNPVPDSLFALGESRWLELQVDAQTMSPRTEITSVAYAYRSVKTDTADYALDAPADGDWVISGNDMYSAVPGSVGIGTATPDAKLHVDGRIKDQTGFVMPVGAILPYAGSSPPEGWLLCDGSSLGSASYPDLFSVISYTYGGSGSVFSLPDLNGRVPVGLDTLDSQFDTLGNTGGEKQHLLLSTEMPSHLHGITDPGHSHSTFDPGHSHGIDLHSTFMGGSGSFIEDADNNYQMSIQTDPASTNLIVNANSTGIIINLTGGGQSHNNLQPYIVLNYIIKY